MRITFERHTFERYTFKIQQRWHLTLCGLHGHSRPPESQSSIHLLPPQIHSLLGNIFLKEFLGHIPTEKLQRPTSLLEWQNANKCILLKLKAQSSSVLSFYELCVFELNFNMYVLIWKKRKWTSPKTSIHLTFEYFFVAPIRWRAKTLPTTARSNWGKIFPG